MLDVLGVEALQRELEELAQVLVLRQYARTSTASSKTKGGRVKTPLTHLRLVRADTLGEGEVNKMSAREDERRGGRRTGGTHRPRVELRVDYEPTLLPADLAEVLLARTPGVYKRRVNLCAVQ